MCIIHIFLHPHPPGLGGCWKALSSCLALQGPELKRAKPLGQMLSGTLLSGASRVMDGACITAFPSPPASAGPHSVHPSLAGPWLEARGPPRPGSCPGAEAERRPSAPGRYLLRAEGVRPVVQNEPGLRVRPAFRPQGRAHARLVLPASHFGVRGSGSLGSPVGPRAREALHGVLWFPKAPCGGKDALRRRTGFWEM